MVLPTVRDQVAPASAVPNLAAVRQGNLFEVPADLLHRPGPRLLDGVQQVCELLSGIPHLR